MGKKMMGRKVDGTMLSSYSCASIEFDTPRVTDMCFALSLRILSL